MRIWMTVDMEGIAGVPVWEFINRDQRDYDIGRELAVGEVNAAIEGCLEMGATEIVVNDSHDGMINLLPEKLNPAAQLLQGTNKPMSMCEGLDYGKYDAAMFIGYHSMAGTLGSLSHTYTGEIRECRINDIPVGEFGLNAALAGYYGVPAVFLAGDETVCAEAKEFVPNLVTAPVKIAFGKKSCLSVHPTVARARIKEGVIQSLKNIKKIKPLKYDSPFEFRVEFGDVVKVDKCVRIPGIKRLSGTAIAFGNKNFKEAYSTFLAVMCI